MHRRSNYSSDRRHGGNRGYASSGRSNRGGRRGGSNRGYGSGKSEYGIRRDQIGGKLVPVNWQHIGLAPFNKLTWSFKETATPQELAQWRQSSEIFLEGDAVPQPFKTFQETGFRPQFLQKFHQLGFTAPTPIQAQAWPMVLTGRDVVGIAETGSGKTLAFVVPGIIHIQNQVPVNFGRAGPVCLIVAPTRELAIQIEAETKTFAESMGVKVACCYGGAPRRNQLRSVAHAEILIATPGRLLDFLERKDIVLHRCTYVVFDEADRMLDMGFEPQIRALMSQVRPDRQMLMFSATWPREVQQLAYDFLPNQRMKIKVGDENRACDNVTQIIEVVGRFQKEPRMLQILQEYRAKTIIFSATKRMADQIARNLQHSGYQADSIHGDKDQWRREQILGDFKRNRITVLVATDVAARGLDVKDLALVLNFDFPNNCDDYIHRVGRTGRAGAKGTAISFFDASKDGKNARKLVQLLEKSSQNVPPQLRSCVRGGGYGGRNNGGRRSGRGGSRFGGRGGRNSRHGSSYRPY